MEMVKVEKKKILRVFNPQNKNALEPMGRRFNEIAERTKYAEQKEGVPETREILESGIAEEDREFIKMAQKSKYADSTEGVPETREILESGIAEEDREFIKMAQKSKYADSAEGVLEIGEILESGIAEEDREFIKAAQKSKYADSTEGVLEIGEILESGIAEEDREFIKMAQKSKYTDSTEGVPEIGERSEYISTEKPSHKKSDDTTDSLETLIKSTGLFSGGDSKKSKPAAKMNSVPTNTTVEGPEGYDMECSYYFARNIMRKYKICHLSEEERILWSFNGKFYEPLADDELEAMIYAEIPDNKKIELSSCKAIKQNVCAYIKDECRLFYLRDEEKDRYFSLDDIKKVYGKVVLNNGVYDVLNDELLEWSSEYPYYYGINAKFLKGYFDEDLETPYFDKILKDATGNDVDSIKMIRYVFGMLLLPNKCKKFPVVGPASNSGKSVLFGQFLDRLLEPNRIMRTSTSELGNRFALGKAEDKILISCLDADVEAISPKAAGIIKRATGEEKMTVEEKYKQSHEIAIRFHFLFGTNGNFSPVKYDSGWTNRIIAVPFLYETPEDKQIPDLLEKLLLEKDAIVTKILRVMRDVVREDGSIRIPESQYSIELKNQWTMCYTFFNEFCEECIDFTGKKEDFCARKDVYGLYESFFIYQANRLKRSVRHEKLTESQFFEKLKQQANGLIAMKRIRTPESKNPSRKLTGIRLKKF